MCCQTEFHNPKYKVRIKDSIMTHIAIASCGFSLRALLCGLIGVVLYKPKSGCQWHMLTVEHLFSREPLNYKRVLGYYRKWCRLGIWKKCCISLLGGNKSLIDLSSIDLKGSHTPNFRGGQCIGYQGRKKRKTTHALYLTDRKGLPLAISKPVGGNHNDHYDIEVQFDVVTETLEEVEIPLDGLFIKADAGFHSKEFSSSCYKEGINANICLNKRIGNHDRAEYFDQDRYNEGYAVECTIAWMDSFRSLVIRFIITYRVGKVSNTLLSL